jgi:hypothetical protein
MIVSDITTVIRTGLSQEQLVEELKKRVDSGELEAMTITDLEDGSIRARIIVAQQKNRGGK